MNNVFDISLNRTWPEINIQEWNLGRTNLDSVLSIISLGQVDKTITTSLEFIVQYEIVGVDNRILSIGSDIIEYVPVPAVYSLHQNYPNPFNPITNLRYDLPEQAQVTLTIYDLIGREVTQLVNTTQDAGYKSVQWNATDSFGKPVSAGVYLYQIQAGEFIQTKKMVLLK